jgi:hypothetical protein
MSERPCERCKAMIPVERIEALPETRLCVKCSEIVGGDFEISMVEENIGKVGSLKKNYSGVVIKKKRRRIEPLNDS